MPISEKPYKRRIEAFCSQFGVKIPFVAAPMAGVTTVEMAAGVCRAGGLGVIAGDFLRPSDLQDEIRRLKCQTQAAFAVNLRVPPRFCRDDRAVAFNEAMSELKAELGCPQDYREPEENFENQLEVILAEDVPVLCVSFGGLREVYAEKIQKKGIQVIAAATSLKEAKVLRSAQSDAIAVQGFEAGGPRLCFEETDLKSLNGLMSLIEPAARATGLPIVASGGLMTGRQMAAALISGASAVAAGSALLRSQESAAHVLHKKALGFLTDTSTVFTAVYEGRLSRVIPNGLIEAIENAGISPASYPAQWAVMESIAQAACVQERDDLMYMPAGAGAHLARAGLTQDIVSALWAECQEVLF